MAERVRKYEIGPAIIEFGEGKDTVLFEKTIGGIELKVETKTRDQKTDQDGETAVSKRITGRGVQVTVPFLEYDLEKIPEIMAGASIIVDKDGKKKVTVRTGVGIDLLSMAKKVVIKPVASLHDSEMWVTLPLAYPDTDLEYAYNNENERVTKITFSSTPTEEGDILILGDEKIKVIPQTA